SFLDLFRKEPLLFMALSDGGQPRPILRVRLCQTILRALAANLPRLGLLRETYDILRIAWHSEQEHKPGGRGIAEFNHLFHAAFQSVIECIVHSAKSWEQGLEADRRPVALLEALATPFLALWYEHSQTLQLSTLEAVRGERPWQTLRSFIQRY